MNGIKIIFQETHMKTDDLAEIDSFSLELNCVVALKLK